MEVHHHTHTERKKWTHYIWEFFMLFLAVTLGFFVENKREHYVEQKREVKYIQSMLSDLAADTSVFHQRIEMARYSLTQLDTLIQLLGVADRSELQEQRIYYLGRMSSRLLPFYVLQDQTYEQMKSSGNLRLLHSPVVAERISEYYNNKNYIERQNEILISRQTVLIESLKKVFNTSLFHSMQDLFTTYTRNPSGNPPLFNNDKSLINELVGSIHYFATVGAVNTNNIEIVMKAGTELITFIKKEYHLK